MPPLPRLRLEVIAELARQLRYEPAEAARRQLERAEGLIRELAADDNAERAFPEDWVIERITGYRPELESSALLMGGPLVTDLTALVERLALAAGVKEEEMEGWLSPDEVCVRWKISRKTLDRYRRRGLPARRVAGEDARHRLFFAPEDIERFEGREGARLSRAGAFDRIDAETERRVIRRARRYRRLFDCSLNQVAQRLAPRFGRSQEAVRQMLARHEARAAEPIFARAGPLGERERRVIDRALRRGVTIERLARRFGRTRSSIHRAANVARAERLRGLDVRGPVSPAFGAPDARERLLAPACVREGLGAPLPATLAELLAGASNGGGAIDRRIEHARATAMWFLRHEAARLVEGLDGRDPSATALDRIETDLRWAARLRVELVRAELPLLVRTIKGLLERPLTTLPSKAAGALVGEALRGLIEASERHDPFKGGRLAAPAGLVMNRAVSRWLREEGRSWKEKPGGRLATPRTRAEDVVLPVHVAFGGGWGMLEPDARIRRGLGRLADSERVLLEKRFGWGPRPHTLEELADETGCPLVHVARVVAAAGHRCIEHARGLS